MTIYYMHNYDKENRFIIVSIIIAVIIIIAIIVGIVLTPRQKVIEVKTISWTYTIQIQELQAVKEEGWSSPPSDAYNISSRRKKRRTETFINAKGKTEQRDVYDTWYEYTVNRWVNTRQATTHDLDKNPYWGEPDIHTSGNNQLGDERESNRKELYEVSGIDLLTNDTTLITFPISHSLWTDINVGDQLNCEFVLGKPQSVQIAQ